MQWKKKKKKKQRWKYKNSRCNKWKWFLNLSGLKKGILNQRLRDVIFSLKNLENWRSCCFSFYQCHILFHTYRDLQIENALLKISFGNLGSQWQQRNDFSQVGNPFRPIRKRLSKQINILKRGDFVHGASFFIAQKSKFEREILKTIRAKALKSNSDSSRFKSLDKPIKEYCLARK